MKRNPRLLMAFVEWKVRNHQRLVAAGIQATLLRPTSGRSKDSASLEFGSRDRLTSATLWDSGESEVITVQVPSESEPIVELAHLNTEIQVFTWLDDVAARHQA